MDAAGRRRRGGFSLVELMIVLAIVALLAGIAYPLYSQYRIRADRSDATGTLMAAWMALERCFVEELDYRACREQVPERSERGLYAIEVDAERRGFTLTAVPAPGSPQEADAACTELTLDHRGERGSAPEPPSACWAE